MKEVIGHQFILKFFQEAIKKNRLAHAYLFSGPAHLGKKRVAKELAKMLLGPTADSVVQPDLIVIKPKGGKTEAADRKQEQISIEQIRELQHQLSLASYQADYKVALIDQAEKLSWPAAHCLLKTLEEPSAHSVIILISSRINQLLPTIISRCQLIRFGPVAQKEISQALQLKDKHLLRLVNGRPGLAVRYLKQGGLAENEKEIIGQLKKIWRAGLNQRYQHAQAMAKDIPQTMEKLNYWLIWFRDLLLLVSGCPELVIFPQAVKYQGLYSPAQLMAIIKKLNQSLEFLANPSLNARLVLEVLMLEI